VNRPPLRKTAIVGTRDEVWCYDMYENCSTYSRLTAPQSKSAINSSFAPASCHILHLVQNMRLPVLAISATALVVQATSLDQVCTVSHVRNSLPENGTFIFYPSTITANAVYNTTVSGQTFFPDSTFDYCNITFAYGHAEKDDRVLQEYWLPSPSRFENRWMSTGGGGFAVSLSYYMFMHRH
jgi:hypothetical protein